jgi:hypothetical protein
MNKGVEGSLASRTSRVPEARVAVDSQARSDASLDASLDASPDDRVIRRRRKHHHRRENLAYRTGRAKEIAFVTLLALAILFGILYYLLPHYQGHGEESGLTPGSAAPAIVLAV